MDELSFRVIYALVGALFIGALFFTFGRKLDRKTYLVPEIIGFLFATITAVLLGGSLVSFILGGVLTGYLLKDVAGWKSLFRAGGLNATLVLTALFIPNTMIIIGGKTYGIFTSGLSEMLTAIAAVGPQVTAEDLLYFLIGNYIFSAFLVIAFVVLGAILGGYVRRILKPAERKVAEMQMQPKQATQ